MPSNLQNSVATVIDSLHGEIRPVNAVKVEPLTSASRALRWAPLLASVVPEFLQFPRPTFLGFFFIWSLSNDPVVACIFYDSTNISNNFRQGSAYSTLACHRPSSRTADTLVLPSRDFRRRIQSTGGGSRGRLFVGPFMELGLLQSECEKIEVVLLGFQYTYRSQEQEGEIRLPNIRDHSYSRRDFLSLRDNLRFDNSLLLGIRIV